MKNAETRRVAEEIGVCKTQAIAIITSGFFHVCDEEDRGAPRNFRHERAYTAARSRSMRDLTRGIRSLATRLHSSRWGYPDRMNSSMPSRQ